MNLPRRSQPLPTNADITDASLRLAALCNGATQAQDMSSYGNDGTVTGAKQLAVGYSHDGTDDKIDFGDIGTIQTVEFWVDPDTTTQELILVDTGKDIMVSSGTITYTGLTAAATYVNGDAGTTLAAGEMSHVMCVFTQVDANNFETANDGTNYGKIEMRDLFVYDEAKSAAFAAWRFSQGVPDSSLVLHTVDGVSDLSRFRHTPTYSGGVVVGKRMKFDGTDDKIDWGDIGNIQTVKFIIDPETTTQEILLVDTGNDIMVDSGTITYTGLTPAATYVNGVATTTLAADVRQHVVCVFTQIDADNFELGTDGTNFGQIELEDVEAFDDAKSADWAMLDYLSLRSYI